jgi:uncharacterized spore protein YtfJ
MEQKMAQKKIVIETPVNTGDLTIIPVVELSINHYNNHFGIYFFAYKNPVAVIIISGTEKKLLTVDDTYLSVDKLLDKVPQLSAILNS